MVNLTPHDIVMQRADGTRVTLPPSGTIARVLSTPGRLEEVPGVPVPVCSPQVWGDIEGLPYPEQPWEPDTLYVVSLLVLTEVARRLGPHNHPCVAPGTGPNDGAIRVSEGPRKGQVEAVTRLVRG